MSDPTWRDPFEDEEARERAARRAQREQRRREERAQESLGERVREEMDARDSATPPVPPPEPEPEPEPDPEPAPPPEPEPETEPAPPEPEPEPEPAPPPPSQPDPEPEPEAAGEEPPDHPSQETGEETAVHGAPPPPPSRPPSSTVHGRRRLAALLGVLALIGAVVAGAAFVKNRRSDVPPPAPEKKRKTIEVVVPEGFDRSQVAEVAKKEGLKGNYVAATRQSNAINLGKLGAGGAESLEGFLFPATYEVFKGANVKVLVRKQLEAFEANAAEANLEKRAEQMGFSVYDLVIVASMVEREIAVPEERGLAASVIFNRLEQGTPLGIDSTIRFEDQNYTEPLVQSRLESNTPYNTRLNTGLPPGPIGNPGLASLEAAADPPKTDFFFFVIKPGTCNEHTFVETDEEFAQAEAAYQAALEAEGGSPTQC